jgi:transketolase
LNTSKIRDLQLKAEEARAYILDTACKVGTGHIAPSFSITELLLVLYFETLNINPAVPDWEDRDRFVLSKGHGSLGLYTVLAMRGFFSVDVLQTFCQSGSSLQGHPDRFKCPGVEVSTGALGHGLSIAVGMALAAKFDHKQHHIVTLMGDGEIEEGSIWEAAMFAPRHRLDNLIGIVDRNRLQMTDDTENIVSLEPLKEKWQSFGWDVQEIDGHSLEAIDKSLKAAYSEHSGKPHLILAQTVKGKGVSFIENRASWHFKIPQGEEAEMAKKEISDRIEALWRK